MTQTLVWNVAGQRLEARHATAGLVAVHAAQLAAWYNLPSNKDLMSNTQDCAAADVEDMYRTMRQDGGMPFLLFVDGVLAGDADLRQVTAAGAEFAIMVGAPASQGKGLGTSFTAMVNVFALRDLALPTVWLSIVPHNTGARRCYEKCGYTQDHGPGSEDVMEAPSDVPMSLTAAALQRCQPLAWAQVTVQD